MLVVENKAKIAVLVLAIQYVFIVVVRHLFFQSVKTSGVWEWFLFSLFYLAGLSFLTIKLFLKEPISKYHLGWKNLSKSQWMIVFSLVLALLAALAGIVLKLEWTKIFPGYVWIMGGWGLTLFVDSVIQSLVVLSTEIFFRGYTQVILKNLFGWWPAVVLQAVMAVGYCYVSMGGLTWWNGAYLLVFNVVLGCLAAVSRSVVVSAVVHWLVLTSIDVIVLNYIR